MPNDVAATGRIGKALEAVRDLLADSAELVSLLGVADAAALKELAILGSVRKQITPPWLIIELQSWSQIQEGNATYLYPTSVSVTAAWTPASVSGDDEQDVMMRAINSWDTVISEITVLIGTATYLAEGDVSQITLPRYAKDDNSTDAGYLMAGLLLDWSR